MGYTPMHMAAYAGCVPIVQELMLYGADVNSLDRVRPPALFDWLITLTLVDNLTPD